MGQVANPKQVDILLTPVDRLTVSNSASGMSPLAAHVIALGENAALNLPVADHVIALGELAGANMGAVSNIIAIGENAATGNTRSDVIVIGKNAMSGGMVAGTITGTVVIGQESAADWINEGGQTGQSTLVGYNIMPNARRFANMVALGANIGVGIVEALSPNTSSQMRNSVLIGRGVMAGPNAVSTTGALGRDNVVIGNNAGNPRSNPSWPNSASGCVFIGVNAANGYGHSASNVSADNVTAIGYNVTISGATGGAPSSSVIIGNGAGPAMAGYGDCGTTVLIGTGAQVTTTVSDVVVIGNGARAGGSNVTVVGAGSDNINGTDNVYIGSGLQATGGSGRNQNVRIGGSIGAGNMDHAASRCIILGHGAGALQSVAGVSDMFLVETTASNLEANRRCILYGIMGAGNLVVGHSNAASRVFGTSGQTNVLKLVEGTRGIGNPAGGGFLFYTAADGAQFVRTNGDQIYLTPPAGVLARSGVNYTDGAGVGAGTLLNAPAAGDPTKWVPINDNGVTRYIPAW
jgi:hypothetical protein